MPRNFWFNVLHVTIKMRILNKFYLAIYSMLQSQYHGFFAKITYTKSSKGSSDFAGRYCKLLLSIILKILFQQERMSSRIPYSFCNFLTCEKMAGWISLSMFFPRSNVVRLFKPQKARSSIVSMSFPWIVSICRFPVSLKIPSGMLVM